MTHHSIECCGVSRVAVCVMNHWSVEKEGGGDLCGQGEREREGGRGREREREGGKEGGKEGLILKPMYAGFIHQCHTAT